MPSYRKVSRVFERRSCFLVLFRLDSYNGAFPPIADKAQPALEGIYLAASHKVLITVLFEEDKKSQRSVYAQLDAVADLKLTYVATCQNYGNQKRSGDRLPLNI